MIGRALALRRAAKTLPIGRLLIVGQLAILAGRHVARLDGVQRARLFELLRKAHGRPASLGREEREELTELIARMEPQAFVGTAVRRLSPIPIPRRVVEGGLGAVGRALRRGG